MGTMSLHNIKLTPRGEWLSTQASATNHLLIPASEPGNYNWACMGKLALTNGIPREVFTRARWRPDFPSKPNCEQCENATP